MLTMSINHPDIEEFIQKKQDLTKVTGANVSVKITDKFIDCVNSDDDYILRFPVDAPEPDDNTIRSMKYGELTKSSAIDGVFYKKVRAREIYGVLVESIYHSAEPGVMFENTMHYDSPDGTYPAFRMVSTNPCQPAWATVLTPNGIRKFSDIKVGDLIWSQVGWTKVVQKSMSGVKSVWCFKTGGGVFYGTKDHKVMLKGNKVEVRNAKSIDSLTGPDNSIVDLDIRDVVDGMAVGSGFVHDKLPYCILLHIPSEETDLLTKLGYLIQCRDHIHKDLYELLATVVDTELSINNSAGVPDRFFTGDAKKVRGFLMGLFSSKGKIEDGVVSIETCSAKMRDDIQIMLSSIGIRSYYTVSGTEGISFSDGNPANATNFCIKVPDVNRFYTRIGFLQKEKMEDLRSTCNAGTYTSVYTDIVDISYVSKEPVYNITVDNKSHTYWTGGLNVSNCGEIGMGAFDSCRLIHMNLTSYVVHPFTDEAFLDKKLLYIHSYEAMRLADDLIDLEVESIDRILKKIEPIYSNDQEWSAASNWDNLSDEFKLWYRIRSTAVSGRRAGLGITGLADTIAMLGHSYGSSKSMGIIDDMMGVIHRAQLDCQVDMAIERGHFPAWDGNNEYESPYDSNYSLGTAMNAWYHRLKSRYPVIATKMYINGRRNISFSTIAPTGTVSLLAQCSSGVEPVFMPVYTRKKKVISDSSDVDYVDVVGEKYTTFTVLHPGLKRWALINGYTEEQLSAMSYEELEELSEKSPYHQCTAHSISWDKRIDIQSLLQEYTTHSISSTINLPRSASRGDIDGIIKHAYMSRCKGVTVYRDGCREGILNKVVSTDNRAAKKRPKVLEADYYQVVVGGEQFIVLVGLLDDKPYEIFTFRPVHPLSLKPHKGKIIKQAKRKYSFESEFIKMEDIHFANLNIEENAATLYSSMLLRHGVDIRYIIKTARKVNANIASFSSAMCRILSKYVKSEEVKGEVCPECKSALIRESGCVHCSSCGWSRCE